ncbi:MAG: hypothetical protein Q8876_02700 [Bacillota bacterium]|nr:hypothetical protein [Bacillota bacterium]
MTLELKLKKAMLTKAIELIVKNGKSPERCARSLIELGKKAYPNTLSKTELKVFSDQLTSLYNNNEIDMIQKLFFSTFISEN